jgi:hypothetical protein
LNIDSSGNLVLDTGDATIYGVRVGRGAGAISTNTAVGASALLSNTTGANNTAIGNNALRSNTTANVNTAIGDGALYSCSTGALNVAVGPFALYSNVSSASNIAIGRDSLYSTTAGGNVGIGTQALRTNTTGASNIGIGDSVLFSNTIGTLNTVIGGRNAAYDNTTGSGNVVVGDLALRFNTIGSNNICVGANAGYNLTTGSNNTIIGNINGTAGLADTVIIGAGSTERLRIDSSGRLLVGTSSGSGTSLLTIQGGAGAAGSDASITLKRGNNNPTVNTQSLGNILFKDLSDGWGASITAVSDGTWSTPSDCPTRLVFSTTADGASSPTEQLRITSDRYVRLASGTGGIQFNGDTAAANALDDYEEGTWTPALGGTATYTVQIGAYTKIGRFVVASFNLAVNVLGTGSTILISGLPFTASSGAVPYAGATSYFSGLAVNVTALTCYAEPGGTRIGFNSAATAVNIATNNPLIFGNSASVQGTVAYFV